MALARLTAWINSLVKIKRNILKNLKERNFEMTGLSPHCKIREKLRHTEEKEHIKSVKYHSLDDRVFSNATEDRSTGDSRGRAETNIC